MFKLVKTTEDGKSLFSCVPNSWELLNVLSWPIISGPNGDKTLIKLIESMVEPEDNWILLPCEVKICGVKSYKEGRFLAETYAGFENTEDEERLVHRNLFFYLYLILELVYQLISCSLENNNESINKYIAVLQTFMHVD